MAGFFSRFKRGGGQRKRGARRGRSTQRRDPRAETEFVPVGDRPPPQPVPQPPPVAPQPPPGYGQPPAPAPSPPQYAPPPQQQAPPPPAAPAPQPPGAAGATQLHSVGPVSSAVVGVLIAIDGKLKDEVFRVYDGENTVGRLPTAEVYLGEQDESISREHAQIIHREGAFGLRPLKETNPTYLNSEAVEGGSSLSDGDTIKLGSTTFRFRTVNPA